MTQIVLKSIADYTNHGFSFVAICRGCERTATLAGEALAAHYSWETPLKDTHACCRRCGQRAVMVVTHESGVQCSSTPIPQSGPFSASLSPVGHDISAAERVLVAMAEA